MSMESKLQRGKPSGRWFPRSYKRAEQWLMIAADAVPPLPEAAFALWRLNTMRTYGQRDVAVAQRRLVEAAEAGHPEACWLAGVRALKAGRDVDAASFWLMGAERGHERAAEGLAKLAPEVAQADAELLALAHQMQVRDREFSLRLELAAEFGLRRHEFLLLDVANADAGGFLVVDVRGNYGKASRRLVRVSRPEQRGVVDRARLILPPMKRMVPAEYQRLCRRLDVACRLLGVPKLEWRR